jgi:hypothetical protein
MKRLLYAISLVPFSLFLPLIARSAVYSVIPQTSASSPVAVISAPTSTISAPVVIALAKLYQSDYGIRPYWNQKPFVKGQDVPPEWTYDVLARLIVCESQGQNRQEIDSNNQWSRGIFQIQDATWSDWSQLSGIKGSAMNQQDATTIAAWAIENGFLSRWSCSKILRIIE